ncbi:hypothetical protein P692DRAFT_20521558 [Suillus brevipes Sb2]|nr:hypothetical protein P692DRAFT_20521558 [Suillus brevipes Sb2]
MGYISKPSTFLVTSIRAIIREPLDESKTTITMRLSFLFAVVAALAASVSVNAQCADVNGLCGTSSAEGDVCCPGLNCKLGPLSGAGKVLYCH